MLAEMNATNNREVAINRVRFILDIVLASLTVAVLRIQQAAYRLNAFSKT